LLPCIVGKEETGQTAPCAYERGGLEFLLLLLFEFDQIDSCIDVVLPVANVEILDIYRRGSQG
jgi:hypothetical protein